MSNRSWFTIAESTERPSLWGISGQVKDGNLVMYDKKTGSLWLQRTNEALEGELQGQVLEELPKIAVRRGHALGRMADEKSQDQGTSL